MADFGALSKLTKKADAVATSASVLVSRSIREIRGELANLTAELNIAGSADDRERAYQMIRDKMGRLSRQLNRLLVAQNNLSAQAAARSASTMTGVEIKYSAKRAKAITEMVTPAQGENLAAVFTDKMGANLIQSLREATVSTMRENAVAGGSMKEMARTMSAKWHAAVKDGVPKFVDSSGREWNTAAYFQMNVRTNTMRVYNDCLIDDVARETGSDVMRISSGGSDPACECASWEGTLISLTGKTPGLPTYEDAKAGGCFHPNCVHTLEVVDEYADKAEIERAQAHPFERPEDDGDIWEAQDNRKYEIDQAVYREQGMDAEQARVAVDRDNLAASIRAGLIREDADAVVAKMTDAQVTALCKDGNPPEFEPFKPTKKELADGAKERWNHGKWGGVVHIAKSATAEDILKVCKVDGEPTAPNSSNSTPPTPPKPKDDKSTVQKTDAAQGAEGGKLEALNLPSSVPSKREDPDALPYLGGFKPSATVEDALSFTEQNVGEVDFDPSQATLGAINRFNEIMSFAIKEHGIGKFKKVSLMTKNDEQEDIVAGVNAIRGTIVFNPHAMSNLSEVWRNGVLKPQHDGKIRKLACPSKEKIREYVGAHEAAHIIYHNSGSSKKKQTLERLLTQMNENGTLSAVSTYARKNIKEFFAELYAMRYCGEELPKHVESQIKEILQ